MRKFRATYQTKHVPEKPVPDNYTLLSFYKVPHHAEDAIEEIGLLVYSFERSDEEIAWMKKLMKMRITDPDLRRLMSETDSPLTTVSLFLRENPPKHGWKLLRVVEIPEPPAEEEHAESVIFMPHSGCIGLCCHPGNPQLSDPWARGY